LEPHPESLDLDAIGATIQRGFLDPASRRDLTAWARDGSAEHRLARRANALVLLDQGMECRDVAKVLLLDDDTVRAWHQQYVENGIEVLASSSYERRVCHQGGASQYKPSHRISETLPRIIDAVGAWIETECRIV
jgi:hypothetical protein